MTFLIVGFVLFFGAPSWFAVFLHTRNKLHSSCRHHSTSPTYKYISSTFTIHVMLWYSNTERKLVAAINIAVKLLRNLWIIRVFFKYNMSKQLKLKEKNCFMYTFCLQPLTKLTIIKTLRLVLMFITNTYKYFHLDFMLSRFWS